MAAIELNLDGLVGPTHHYAGLAHGNVAAAANRGVVSNPRAAALEGLAKAKRLTDLGVPQGVLPPQDRPDVAALRRLGFSGADAEILRAAAHVDPRILSAVASASSMWTANAATISPSADTGDERVHVTPANLVAHLHRSLESALVACVLHRIFPDPARFAHHEPLLAAEALSDEGAANHMRLCRAFGEPGIEVFIFGREGLDAEHVVQARFGARQTRDASEAVARLHRLSNAATAFIRQEPAAVDAGAFHNDVVAVGHRDVLLVHERAWLDGHAVIDELERCFERRCEAELRVLRVSDRELSLADTVATYLFNSQLVTLGDGSIALIAPEEVSEHGGARAVVERLVGPGRPIGSAHFVGLRQSMRNGGGPACLRLRVELTDAEQAAMETGVLLDDVLHARLVAWVERHYRDRLEAADLADSALLDESRTALDELTGILGLGSLYPFQLAGG